jgi:hypothetical protein
VIVIVIAVAIVIGIPPVPDALCPPLRVRIRLAIVGAILEKKLPIFLRIGPTRHNCHRLFRVVDCNTNQRDLFSWLHSFFFLDGRSNMPFNVTRIIAPTSVAIKKTSDSF